MAAIIFAATLLCCILLTLLPTAGQMYAPQYPAYAPTYDYSPMNPYGDGGYSGNGYPMMAQGDGMASQGMAMDPAMYYPNVPVDTYVQNRPIQQNPMYQQPLSNTQGYSYPETVDTIPSGVSSQSTPMSTIISNAQDTNPPLSTQSTSAEVPAASISKPDIPAGDVMGLFTATITVGPAKATNTPQSHSNNTTLPDLPPKGLPLDTIGVGLGGFSNMIGSMSKPKDQKDKSGEKEKKPSSGKSGLGALGGILGG